MNMTNDQMKNYVDRFALMEYYSQSDCPTGNNIRYQFFRIYKRRTLLELFKKALNKLEKNKVMVLDVGCGDSSDMNYVVCQMTGIWTDWNVVRNIAFYGIDADPKSVSFSSERFKALGLNAEFRLGDLTAMLPYADNSFDVIVCSEVVEHLQEPLKLLKEIYRVLRVGGYMILTTNNKPNVFTWLKSPFRKHRNTGDDEIRTFDLPDWDIRTFGHINLKPTRYWEDQCKTAGFLIRSYGPYQTVQRTGSNSLSGVAFYFMLNYLMSKLPCRIGRYLSDTTAFMSIKCLPCQPSCEF